MTIIAEHTVTDALIEALGASAVIYGETLRQRPTSYWDASPTLAKALIRPRSTGELSKALAICHRFNQPVVTQGGLTGCTSGAVASPEEVLISFERMTAIEDIDVEGNTATVQAGAVLQVVQEAVEEHGLLFPLDLGARGTCTIGGNIATNAGGINVLRYGMMRNLVLGLEVVLADGTIISSMNQMLKNNAGYDIKQLFIGSEGTLGIVTRAVLKLYPKMVSCHSALVAMDSFDQVSSFLQTARQTLAGTLSAYEVMWGNYFHAVTDESGHRAPIGRDYAFYVMLEATGASPEHDEEPFNQMLEQAFIGNLIVDAVIPKSEAERRLLWDIREDFEPVMQPKPVYIYDISLPIKDMDNYVNQVEEELKRTWPDSHYYVLGHIADGNLHLFVKPNVDEDTRDESDRIVYNPLRGYNGSVSAEHGIGVEKKAWLSHTRSDAEIRAMQMLKQTFDPKCLLNFGKVLD